MFDIAGFRAALGKFATGITIVTAQPDDAAPVGLTVNSFNSVSLDPPLVLWSLNRQAHSLPIFSHVGHFGVSILSAQQMDLSQRFASPIEDRFDGVDVFTSVTGAPLIQNSTAWFDCQCRHYYEGGDHLIFVGEVLAFGLSELPALLYEGGKYKVTGPHSSLPEAAPRYSAPETSIADGDLGQSSEDLSYLLAKASKWVSGELHNDLKQNGLSTTDWRILSCLLRYRKTTVGQLAQAALAPQPTVTKAIDRLCVQKFVQRDADTKDRRKASVSLTEQGRSLAQQLATAAGHYENAQLSTCTKNDIAALRSALAGVARQYNSAVD